MTGLRERRRMRTMRTIQQEALRLFAKQGFEATTVEQIAEAAEISQSTFFRYYPSKEDVLNSDEFDSVFDEAIRNRPPDEDILTSVRAATLSMLPEMEQAKESVLERFRLLMETPSLRGNLYNAQTVNVARIARVVAARLGRPEDDYEARLFAAAMAAIAFEAVRAWLESGGTLPLEELLDKGFAILRSPGK